MRVWADFTSTFAESGAQTLVVSGPLLVSTIGVIDRRLRELEGEVAAIDISAVTEIDTVGAWTVWRMVRDHDAKLLGASAKAERLIAAVQEAKGEGASRAPRASLLPRVFNAVGEQVVGWARGTKQIVGFLGAVVIAFGSVIRHPSTFRGRAVVRQLEHVGVSGMGIIGLMSFLVGIVIAQQGAENLRDFGAEIYTINLTGRLALRELGVLMTAIMVAGRSGSAFAAELGTMKLTEEVDAMRTIGVSPATALVLPRVIAVMIMMPLLGFFAALAAIIGGAFISSLTLDIPFMTFLARIQEVVPTHDLWVGLIKGPVFGLIIGLSGCYQGMQVKGNSEEVGLRTTMAVVQGIFMVIVLDAFFAVFFSYVGWG
jgi:phospholipid/cholesterol/gamma-HCH transport system permease protein